VLLTGCDLGQLRVWMPNVSAQACAVAHRLQRLVRPGMGFEPRPTTLGSHTILLNTFPQGHLATRQPPQFKGLMSLDRCRHAKLLTDTGDRKLWNLPVTRYRSPAMGRRVLPD
jgi:hypothetical protein